jgi:prolyl oligopeptidase
MPPGRRLFHHPRTTAFTSTPRPSSSRCCWTIVIRIIGFGTFLLPLHSTFCWIPPVVSWTPTTTVRRTSTTKRISDSRSGTPSYHRNWGDCNIGRHCRSYCYRSPTQMIPATTVSASTTETSNVNDDLLHMDTTADDDPYLWLEDVESTASLHFAATCNAVCIEQLGNPVCDSPTYQRILDVLESNDRIPTVSQYGIDNHEQQKEAILYNFWKDSDHPKGLWRKTTFSSYASSATAAAVQWETVLDVDALAVNDDISWVWKGSTPLPRSRDDHVTDDSVVGGGGGPIVTRTLLSLSRGGSDAVHIKEFDLTSKSFVTDQPFHLPEAKTRASYKSRNVLLVGSDFGPDTVTDSGYPKQVREWVRGTDIEQAPIVFEGEKTDVSVGMYIVDERTWGGNIYEVQYRSLTFYTSKYWIRQIQWEHLLAPTDPRRDGVVPDPGPFVPLAIPDDANMSLLGKMLIITLRSDWNVAGTTYRQGSAIVTDLDTFIGTNDPHACVYTVLFEPTERTAYQYSTATKNYLIVSTMDHVKSKLSFYKIVENGSALVPLRYIGEEAAQIRDCTVTPVDPYSGSDDFWFSTSDFVTPATLYLANAAQMDPAAVKSVDISHTAATITGTTTTTTASDPFILRPLKSLPPQYDSANLIVEQRIAISKDGTEIPYFIIMNRDIVLNGQNPTLLYGYGGFEVSLGPHYIATAGLAWLERGGVYVEANIRGGGEFGPVWHQAGLKANRNKCYEDFIAVGEHLIATHICTSPTLAARGGSNVRCCFFVVAAVVLWFGAAIACIIMLTRLSFQESYCVSRIS